MVAKRETRVKGHCPRWPTGNGLVNGQSRFDLVERRFEIPKTWAHRGPPLFLFLFLSFLLSFSLSFFFLLSPFFSRPFLCEGFRNIVIVVQYGKWRTWKNRLIQRANRSVARANRRRKGVSDVARGTGPLTFATTLLSCEGRRRCARIVG